MLGRIRHQLRLIRYYSASQNRTGWTIAHEVLLLASVILAVPAMLFCEATISRTESAEYLRGTLLFTPAPGSSATGSTAAGPVNPGARGTLVAVLEDSPEDPSRPNSALFGDFLLHIDDFHRGWPFTSTINRQPAKIDLNIYSQPGARENIDLAEDSPERAAIQKALEQDKRSDLLRAWRGQAATEPHRHWRGSFGGTLVWWTMLSFASATMLQITRFCSLFFRARRHNIKADRRARGRCAVCNYNMRGLEFNERCPECGSIVE